MVAPMEGPLEPGESVQMKVSFNPKACFLGDHLKLLSVGGFSFEIS